MFKSSVGDVGMPGHEDLSCVAGHSLLLMPFRATRLKAESQKPQEMRFRCIMAGFDPDAPRRDAGVLACASAATLAAKRYS